MSKLLFEQHTRQRLIDLSLRRLGGDSHHRSLLDLTHGLPLVLTLKSGSDWGPTNFLHTTSPSSSRTLPSFANQVLTKFNADDMTSDSNYKFVRYVDLAMNPAEESAVDNFAVADTVGLCSSKKYDTHAGGHPA